MVLVLLWKGSRFGTLRLKQRMIIDKLLPSEIVAQIRAGATLKGSEYRGSDHPVLDSVLEDHSVYDKEGWGSVDIERGYATHVWIDGQALESM